MDSIFPAQCRATLIGSLPMTEHAEALDLVLEHAPQIPPWVQLPVYPREHMVPQFIEGLPGVVVEADRMYIDTDSEAFGSDLLAFYEEYLEVTEQNRDCNTSRFVLTPRIAPGLFELLNRCGALDPQPLALKGQVTGPVTMGTGVRDQNDRAIFYDQQLREAMVKLLALKAGWQTRTLAQQGSKVIVFIDEPALAGFGSSELISISAEEITLCLEEIIAAIHQAGGLAGIHVCANTDWGVLLETQVDVINFDAYSYFDNLILYADQLRAFLDQGRLLAWGLIPTLDPADVDKESIETLCNRWDAMMEKLANLGFSKKALAAQALITPSCGAGSLDETRARKVLALTQGVSERIRQAL